MSKEDYGDYFAADSTPPRPPSTPPPKPKPKRKRSAGSTRGASFQRPWVEPWYVDESVPGWHGKGLPPCTNTAGDPIKRLGFVAIKRVMDDPVDMTYERPILEYALVWCESLGIGLTRFGEKLDKAEFTVSTYNGFKRQFVGAKGRDDAVRFYLRLLKARRHYYFTRAEGKMETPAEKDGQ